MAEDEFLYSFRQKPRPEFAATLARRLATAAPAPRRWAGRRVALGLSAAGMGLALAVCLWPAGRAYALNVIVQLGHLIVSTEPTHAEQFEAARQTATEAPAAEASPAPVAWQANVLLTREEAQAQAGFAIAQLGEAPAGLALVVRLVTPPGDDSPYTAGVTTYQGEGATLTLRQLAYAPNAAAEKLPVGEALVQEVSVGGQPGVWLEGLRLSTYVNEAEQVAPQFANLLVWQAGEFAFWLQTTPGLPLEAMRQLAEGLTLN